MRTPIPFWTAVGAACVGLPRTAHLGAAPPASEASVPRLIGQRGSPRYADRQAATRALAGLGPQALEALRQAAHSPDAEVSLRASRLVRDIEKRQEMGRLLAAHRVRLVYRDTPVPQAVKD